MDITERAWDAAAAVGTPKRPVKQERPFGLTARQCEAVSLFVKCSCVKRLAAQMDVTYDQACRMLRRVRARMGVSDNVQMALKWDQHVRAEHQFTSSRTRSVFALGGQP